MVGTGGRHAEAAIEALRRDVGGHRLQIEVTGAPAGGPRFEPCEHGPGRALSPGLWPRRHALDDGERAGGDSEPGRDHLPAAVAGGEDARRRHPRDDTPVDEAPALALRGQIDLEPGSRRRLGACAGAAADAYGRVASHAWRASSLVQQAEALAGASDLAAAQAARQQALQLYESLGEQNDARACRLLIADGRRMQGDPARALAEVQAELPALAEMGALDNTYSPLGARMAAWRVLAACGDAHAPQQLELAWAELQRQVAKIADPAVCARVLEGTPLHREIVAAHAAVAASTG